MFADLIACLRLKEPGPDEQEPAATQRSRRRQARVMRATPKKPGADNLQPEELDRENGVPPQWEEMLDRQESFIEDLLGE
ncbi:MULTISPECIES: hypothetical protein [unclassified Roseovarius]|uniref:hypothetical protein n=1 Tax=unclassified Roseovarius TaxID=2614913 RepID=UPI00273EB520|nr:MULTISPECIES: hypothetical protein [unclassified Roseovarius]